jgi:hypothetical protein
MSPGPVPIGSGNFGLENHGNCGGLISRLARCRTLGRVAADFRLQFPGSRGLLGQFAGAVRPEGVTLEALRFRDAVTDLGHSSEAPLRYEEAKLDSRGSVDEQDGGMIRRITFFYYIGWDDFPLAIFQILPLV